jgi:hypothetical protein
MVDERIDGGADRRRVAGGEQNGRQRGVDDVWRFQLSSRDRPQPSQARSQRSYESNIAQ